MRTLAIALGLVWVSGGAAARADTPGADAPPASEWTSSRETRKVVLTLSPDLAVSMVPLLLEGSRLIEPGAVGAGATAALGWTHDGVFVGFAGSYLGYPTRSVAESPGVVATGRADAGSIGFEIGRLVPAGIVYRMGFGGRALAATRHEVIHEAGDADSMSALFFGPTTYMAGGWAFALGGGFSFEPLVRLGASALYAPEATFSAAACAACGGVSHPKAWGFEATAGLDLAIAWAK
jgi:hypothetical protein